jgi:hypothetical protein|tara:strand:- start:4071 stop:4508 length:438 start_codon:yes stop_codon:yes gene_type:complete
MTTNKQIIKNIILLFLCWTTIGVLAASCQIDTNTKIQCFNNTKCIGYDKVNEGSSVMFNYGDNDEIVILYSNLYARYTDIKEIDKCTIDSLTYVEVCATNVVVHNENRKPHPVIIKYVLDIDGNIIVFKLIHTDREMSITLRNKH